jgi:DNA-binding beta-propeller fold protein YncE
MVLKGEPYIFVPSCSPHLSHIDCTVKHNIVDGPFHPRDVAVDAQNGSIYVAATYAQRMDKFDSSGNFILSWGWWEKDNGVLNHPSGMAIDVLRGYIYVADTYNHIIQKFDMDGNYLTSWGYSARVSAFWDGGDGSFDFPTNITTDDAGNVYVINPSAHYSAELAIRRIQKFDQNGTFLGGWNYNDPTGRIFLHNLKGVVYNPFNGCLYVVNARDNVIQCFDTSGNFQFEFGGSGGAAGEFNYPTKIAVDRNNGDIYVIDHRNYRIQKFSSNGSYLMQWGGYGSGDGQFRLEQYSGIHVDDNGYVYLADSINHRIEVFDSNGNYFVQLFVGGSPSGIVVDSNGYVYVSDRWNEKIDKYTPIPQGN